MVLLLMMLLPIRSVMSEPQEQAVPAISETVVMLYYKDIIAATSFYAEPLGLEMTFNQDSAKLFRLTPSSVVGVIREGKGSHHKVQATNAVMLSIVTPMLVPGMTG
jgi:hypothetical protein